MKDQVNFSNDNAVKNLDIGALLQKKSHKKLEDQQAKKSEASIIEKVEENFAQMMESIEEGSENVFAEIKSSKAIYLSLAGGAAVLGGAFLVYRFLTNKKSSLKVSPIVRKTLTSPVQSVARKAKKLTTKAVKKNKK